MDRKKNFYAHTKGESFQLLRDHLRGTASRAEDIALPEYGLCAYFAGLLHDIGKYQPSFQNRLCGASVKVEHSICGAKEVEKRIHLGSPLEQKFICRMFQYVIAGHHSGLPDYGEEVDMEDSSTLLGRLRRKSEDYSSYSDEIGDLVDAAVRRLPTALSTIFSAFNGWRDLQERYSFLIRYLYSCLTDADFLDTETFCLGRRSLLPKTDFSLALERVKKRMKEFRAETRLQITRGRLQEQALKNAECGGKIYLLNMPTGSGKTLCSMRLALERVIKTGKKRIIYVIPYTSIIEQTAEEFRPFFLDTEILEHHSNFDFEETEEPESDINGVLKKSAENWDASVIITTNVQFFESIYSNKSSRLRKLHNMADSVIVFDEIHTLPFAYFLPCMKAIGSLTADYRAEAIFLTATMPSFTRLAERYPDAFCRIKPVDLLPDKSDYPVFDQCGYEYLGECDPLERIDYEKSTLIICNAKKTAKGLYDGCPLSEERKYFLSTYTAPEDRSRLIAEIKERLKGGEKPIVFATSLVEAGVDFDFECVFRELTGLDHLLQAGGRCNREGRRSREESKVYIFKSERRPSADIALMANVTAGIIGDRKTLSFSLCEIEDYFDEISRFYIKPSEKEVGQNNFYKIPFASIAQNFKFIDNTTCAVVVQDKVTEAEIAKLKAVGFCNMRLLLRHSATVSKSELDLLISKGMAAEVGGVFLLTSSDYYSSRTGIKLDDESDFIY